MSVPATMTIPFEQQSDPRKQRDCGAACLRMVYRSLGKSVPRDELWRSIAKENRFGSLASTTHLMTKDAIARGFSAVAFQARHPLQALRLCRELDVRAILNLRPARDTSMGHYGVLVHLDDNEVVLHDPFYGPLRRMPHADLLELWRPSLPNPEIAGYVLIGITAKPADVTTCWLCQTPMPASAGCPKCQKPVSLTPNTLLGCASSDCISRTWNCVCCPECDNLFSFSPYAPVPGVAATPSATAPAPPAANPAAAPAEDPFDLGRVFAEVDKFCNFILTLPGAAEHSEIKKQLDFITAGKQKLELARVEAMANQKAHQEQLAQFVQTAKQNEEAHLRKLELLNKPSLPLDGNALGRALLKNLGYLKG